MNRHTLLAALAALTLAGTSAQAQDQTRDQAQDRTQQTLRDQDMYGYQMMSPAERDEYRNRMRTATTAEERERIRAEHHERMVQRARERGITLPEAPPAGRGPGMYPKPGPGMGPGPGGGGPARSN